MSHAFKVVMDKKICIRQQIKSIVYRSIYHARQMRHYFPHQNITPPLTGGPTRPVNPGSPFSPFGPGKPGEPE